MVSSINSVNVFPKNISMDDFLEILDIISRTDMSPRFIREILEEKAIELGCTDNDRFRKALKNLDTQIDKIFKLEHQKNQDEQIKKSGSKIIELELKIIELENMLMGKRELVEIKIEEELFIKNFAKVVCDFLKVDTVSVLNRKNRGKVEESWARHVCMFLLRKRTRLSLKKVGRAFGGRKYSTVCYACKVARNELKNSDLKREEIKKIELLLIKASC